MAQQSNKPRSTPPVSPPATGAVDPAKDDNTPNDGTVTVEGGANFTEAPTVGADAAGPGSSQSPNMADGGVTRMGGGTRPEGAETVDGQPKKAKDSLLSRLEAEQRDADEHPVDSTWVNGAGQLVLGPEAELTFEGTNLGDGNVRVDRDVVRQFYPVGSKRPSYSQLLSRGYEFPVGVAQSMYPDAKIADAD